MPDQMFVPACPYCGRSCVGQRDYTPGLAMLAYIGNSENDVEWAGDTKMFWDEQFPQNDPITYGCLACGETFFFEQMLAAAKKVVEQEECDANR